MLLKRFCKTIIAGYSLLFIMCSISISESRECTVRIIQDGREITPGIDNKISTYNLKADVFRIVVDGRDCSPVIFPISDDEHIGYLLKTPLIFSSCCYEIAERPETNDIFGGFEGTDPTTTIEEIIIANSASGSDVNWATKKYSDICDELKYCPTPAKFYARHWPFINKSSPTTSYAEFKRWTDSSPISVAAGLQHRVVVYTVFENIAAPNSKFSLYSIIKPHILIFNFKPDLPVTKPVPSDLAQRTSIGVEKKTEKFDGRLNQYGSYDPKRLLTVTEASTGKKYGLDKSYLDTMLNDLASHAISYPPRFDSPEDRQRAVKDVGALSGMLDILANNPNATPELLLSVGMLNSIGYNLDIPGTAEKAISVYRRLLAASPSHPRGNYLYGMFLAGAGKFSEAIHYLEKAVSVNVTEASYTLGITYMSLGEKQKALENLESYLKRNPGDVDAAKLIDSIRDGSLEIKRKAMETRTLSETDHGVYAVVDTKGQITNKVFKVLQRNSEWVVEDKRPDGSWVPVTCTPDCKLSVSSESDIKSFFTANALAQITPTCVHSKAFAFCAYSMKKGPALRGYVMVALTQKAPIVLKLTRVSSDKTLTPNPIGKTPESQKDSRRAN